MATKRNSSKPASPAPLEGQDNATLGTNERRRSAAVANRVTNPPTGSRSRRAKPREEETPEARKPAQQPVPVENAPGVSDRERIALLAYSFWEARGRQGGSPEEDWFRAEKEIRNSGGATLTQQ